MENGWRITIRTTTEGLSVHLGTSTMAAGAPGTARLTFAVLVAEPGKRNLGLRACDIDGFLMQSALAF
jgi:hypothetical protein